MKLEGKKIAFGLTNVFYAFKDTIAEIRNIKRSGGEIIPIMLSDTYNGISKYGKLAEFAEEIEKISNRKIVYTEEEAEKIDVDIIVSAPFCRKSYCKTLCIYL